MAFELGSTLRLVRPAPHVLGFYDGRIEGVRAHSPGPNWLDDGAFTLGVCAYAVVDGAEALLFDTQISPVHGALIRRWLEAEGVGRIRVAYSHWHPDHIAGAPAFADCEIIANRLTDARLREKQAALAERTPPVAPLVWPTRLYEETLALTVGTVAVELRQAEIHSRDGSVLWLPATGLLLAADTLEDPVTYVAEPDRLPQHLAELDRLASWPIHRILPSHGALDRIESGGYGPEFIAATRRYVEKLIQCRTRPEIADPDLRRFAAEAFATGAVEYFPAYEPVHRANLAAIAG